MQNMIVQIYEIQTPEEAEKCIELGVDNVGSVLLSEKNWRQPVLKETTSVSEGTHAKNSIIPLFQEIDTLYRVLDYYQPHFLHLCENLVDHQGQEINLEPFISLQSKIKERYREVEIIRSLPLPRSGLKPDFPTLPIARKLESVSDLFLTWLGEEPVKGYIGITGKRCDLKIARELILQCKIPVILAGGLSPENIYNALMETGPAGADSCTQTNKVDKSGNPVRFKKDFAKVKKFVDEVERAEKIGPQGFEG
jgi:phosphoribosylanthranilate isomerase